MRTTIRNPPSSNYQRPAERKFWVWRDENRVYMRGYGTAYGRGRPVHMWRWLCTLCDPPASGCRTMPGAWEKIITVSMPHHFQVRHQHHQHVGRSRG